MGKIATAVWRVVQVAILGATYGIARYGPKEGFTARLGWFGCFVLMYTVALFGLFVWSRILYPLFFTPLLKLPQVPVRQNALHLQYQHGLIGL